MNQGRIEQLDEPSKLYSFPANRFVADFLGNAHSRRHGQHARRRSVHL